MSSRQPLLLLLASLLVITGLSSCTEGSLASLHEVRTGAMGIGPSGTLPGDRLLPRFKPESARETQVHLAVRRGVEKALTESRSFDYVPFSRMKNIPASVNPVTQRAEVRRFAATNNLEAVIRVWTSPSIHQGSVSVSFLTNASDGKFVASGIALAPATSPLFNEPFSRDALRIWEKTAYAAMKKALAKVRG